MMRILWKNALTGIENWIWFAKH